VDRDVDPELLGQLPFEADDVLLAEVGATRREGHRDQPLVVAQLVAPDAASVVAVDPLDAAAVVRAEPPGLDRGVREAEGEDRSQPGIAEPLERGVRVLRRVHDV
jgi:hypothetical protein